MTVKLFNRKQRLKRLRHIKNKVWCARFGRLMIEPIAFPVWDVIMGRITKEEYQKMQDDFKIKTTEIINKTKEEAAKEAWELYPNKKEEG